MTSLNGHRADATSLTGVSETALLTLRSRANEARRPDGIIDDPMAIRLMDSIDYDFAKFGSHARQDIALRLLAVPEQQVRGLAGLELETASGLRLRLDRGPGGLHAHRHDPGGGEREWTILGASRGEAGILGEGIRQALLRDPTFAPALAAAAEIVP